MSVIANSYFSGAGIFDIGFLQAGIKIQQSFEIDPVCCETQRANFQHEIVQMDLTEKLVLNVPKADV